MKPAVGGMPASLRPSSPCCWCVEIAGIVVNQFQTRARLPRRMVDELVDEGLPVLEPAISASVKIRESHEAARPLAYLAPRHKLSEQFVELHANTLGAR